MPPKLPRCKSKKHAEGCFCAKCLAKREIPKKQPVHVRFKFNKDIESEDDDSLLPSESLKLKTQQSNGKIKSEVKQKTSKKKSSKLRTPALDEWLCVSCKLKGRANVHVAFCGKCFAENEHKRRREEEAEVARKQQEPQILQSRNEELMKLKISRFKSKLRFLPFHAVSLSYATNKYYGKEKGLSRKKGGAVSKDNQNFLINNFSNILKIHKIHSQWLCCQNRVDKMDVEMMEFYVNSSQRKLQQKLASSVPAALPSTSHTRIGSEFSKIREHPQPAESSGEAMEIPKAEKAGRPIQITKQQVGNDHEEVPFESDNNEEIKLTRQQLVVMRAQQRSNERKVKLEQFQSESVVMPFIPVPLTLVIDKYYGLVKLHIIKNDENLKNLGTKRERKEYSKMKWVNVFAQKFSSILKIHKGLDGNWLCCRNRTEKADFTILNAYYYAYTVKEPGYIPPTTSLQGRTTKRSAETETESIPNEHLKQEQEDTSGETEGIPETEEDDQEYLLVENDREEVQVRSSVSDSEEMQVKNGNNEEEIQVENVDSDVEDVHIEDRDCNNDEKQVENNGSDSGMDEVVKIARIRAAIAQAKLARSQVAVIKRLAKLEKFQTESVDLPFLSVPLTSAIIKYYSNMLPQRNEEENLHKSKLGRHRQRMKRFINKFSSMLKIHQGVNGKWMCCKNQVMKTSATISHRYNYLKEPDFFPSTTSDEGSTANGSAETRTESTPSIIQNNTSQQEETTGNPDIKYREKVQVENGDSDVEEQVENRDSDNDEMHVENGDGSTGEFLGNLAGKRKALAKTGRRKRGLAKLEKVVSESVTQRFIPAHEQLPIQNVEQLNEKDCQEIQVENDDSDIEELDVGDSAIDDDETHMDMGHNIDKEALPHTSVNFEAVNSEESGNFGENCKDASSSDSDVESIITPSKRKTPHNVLLDDSDEEKRNRLSWKRIKLIKCSINLDQKFSPKPSPRVAKRKPKNKGRVSKPKSIPVREDSETDPDFTPTSSDSESSASDYESVASSSLSEDEEEPSTHIVSDSDDPLPNNSRVKPIVIVETVADLATKEAAEDLRSAKLLKLTREREDYEEKVLGKLRFSRCSLAYGIDVISIDLGWDEFPFGAKMLNRGRITPKQLQNPNSGEWFQLKRQFVMRHFKTALSITPCQGKWYCCRNRVDKLNFSFYLSRYWNIESK